MVQTGNNVTKNATYNMQFSAFCVYVRMGIVN